MSGGVPPSSRAGRRRRSISNEIEAASDLRERFTGHASKPPKVVNVPPIPGAIAVIGQCEAICYRTVRDGKTEHYIHEFARSDQPMFGISPDGQQILLIGGRFVFTERGIVDLSDTKNLPKSLRPLAKHRGWWE